MNWGGRRRDHGSRSGPRHHVRAHRRLERAEDGDGRRPATCRATDDRDEPCDNAGRSDLSGRRWTAAASPACGSAWTASASRARLLAADKGAARWMLRLPGRGADFVSKTVEIYAADRVGNRAQAVQMTVTLDDVAPELTAAGCWSRRRWANDRWCCRGACTTAARPHGYSSWCRRPTARGRGRTRRAMAASGGTNCRARCRDATLLWVQAADQAGNTRTIGPYAVDVTCTDAALVTALTAGAERGRRRIHRDGGDHEHRPGALARRRAGDAVCGRTQPWVRPPRCRALRRGRRAQ